LWGPQYFNRTESPLSVRVLNLCVMLSEV